MTKTHYKILFDSLCDPNISKKDWDTQQDALLFRIKEVWLYILEQSNRNYFDDDIVGYKKDEFDPVAESHFVKISDNCSEFITTVDDFQTYDNQYYKYGKGFPTALLWDTNWQQTIRNHVDEAVRSVAADRLAAKKTAKKERERANHIWQTALIASIKDKTKPVLTDEEYNWLISNI